MPDSITEAFDGLEVRLLRFESLMKDNISQFVTGESDLYAGLIREYNEMQLKVGEHIEEILQMYGGVPANTEGIQAKTILLYIFLKGAFEGLQKAISTYRENGGYIKPKIPIAIHVAVEKFELASSEISGGVTIYRQSGYVEYGQHLGLALSRDYIARMANEIRKVNSRSKTQRPIHVVHPRDNLL